ncbi:MAG: hypothetical protein PHG91_05695, partial [Syntrophales bacterium]|nr:hypothetical protein [Syntrophales bacterium]
MSRKFCLCLKCRILRPFPGIMSMGFRLRRIGIRASFLSVSAEGVLVISAEIVSIVSSSHRELGSDAR